MIHVYGLYKNYSTASEKRDRLHALSQLIIAAEKLEQLMKKHNLATTIKLGDFDDKKTRSVLNTLKKSRYKNEKSIFFLFPTVHSFLYNLYEVENRLAPVLSLVGEIDSYNAIAKKMLELQTTEQKICFSYFIDQEKPTVAADRFWNILVKNPITNSLIEERNIVLTGPNAGGKTTAIRAILQNIVLSQTFGIAAAERFGLTPFDVVYSYLNVSDDLVGGLFLFASEVKRAQEILQRINTLESQSKFFFALDELFTGTVAEDGQECAYTFVSKLLHYKNIQFIYATHFQKLKEIANINTENCANYKADAPVKNDECKLVYPFTISQGASDCRIALDLAREANLFS